MKRNGVVLDTSVMLNILGSGHAAAILGALDGRRVAVTVTSGEVVRHPLERGARDPLATLISAGLLEQIELPGIALARFLELTGATAPDDLGDGEAGAIAAAEALQLAVALDERKGRRVAAARVPHVEIISSGSIFADLGVGAVLGPRLADAVFSALLHARMRILEEHDAWVRALLGPIRVVQCPSLKRRQGQR